MIPTYELTGESFELKDRGWIVYTARLTCKCDIDDLSTLKGTKVHDKTILAIERFGVQDQSFKNIGLAVSKEESLPD